MSTNAARVFADRLRTLPESRLQRSDGTETLAAAGLRLAQLLADLAAGVTARDGSPPPPRRVPDVGPFAVADQIAVTAADLAQALDGVDPAVHVWAPDGSRAALCTLLDRLDDRLQTLARLI
ncbi:MAG: hypothetical protein ACT4QG_00315 [Sporichthyaceae bacterium]